MYDVVCTYISKSNVSKSKQSMIQKDNAFYVEGTYLHFDGHLIQIRESGRKILMP